MPVIATIDVKTQPGKRIEFMQALRASLAATLNEPECSRLDYLVDDSDPNRVVVIEEWTSPGAHQAYSMKLVQAGGMNELMPFMDGMPATTYYERMG